MIWLLVLGAWLAFNLALFLLLLAHSKREERRLAAPDSRRQSDAVTAGESPSSYPGGGRVLKYESRRDGRGGS